MSLLERAALGPPLGRAGDLQTGDAIDLGGVPVVVLEVVEGPRAEPGDPRTVWVRLEHGGPARPMLADDPVRMISDLGARAVWSEDRRSAEREAHRNELPNLHRDVGRAVLAAWRRAADLSAGLAVAYLAVVTASSLASGPVPADTVARLLRLDGSTARHHLRGLVDAGLLEVVREQRRHLYRPSIVDGPSDDV